MSQELAQGLDACSISPTFGLNMPADRHHNYNYAFCPQADFGSKLVNLDLGAKP
jgi:hypothetical protein